MAAAPSGNVWIVVEHRDGKLSRMSKETLVAGQDLARQIEVDAEAIVLGADLSEVAAQVAVADLKAVRVAEAEPLGTYTPGAYIGVLAPAITAAAPAYVLFPHSYQTVDYMPRLAQSIDAAILPEVIGFRVADSRLLWRRPILAGKLHAELSVREGGPVLVSVQSAAFAAGELSAGSSPVTELAFDRSGIRPDRELLGVEKAGDERVDLSQAEVVVAVGRGIGSEDKLALVRELAEVLDAEIGASRPVVDSEWLPRDRQIGSSGQTIAPKLYVAVGISGAIQHLVGMKGSQVIVAINKDPSAPIFGVAQYGIVGDLHEVIPPLIQALREARAR